MRIEVTLQLLNFHLTDFKDLGPANTHLCTVSLKNTRMSAYTFLYFSYINYQQNESVFLIFPKIINLKTRAIYAANIPCLLCKFFILFSHTVSSILEVELYYLKKYDQRISNTNCY